MSFISPEDLNKVNAYEKERRFKKSLSIIEKELKNATINNDGYYYFKSYNKGCTDFRPNVLINELDEFLPYIERKGFYVKLCFNDAEASYEELEVFIKPDASMKDNVMESKFSRSSNGLYKNIKVDRIFKQKIYDKPPSINLPDEPPKKEAKDPSFFMTIKLFFKLWGDNNKF